MGSPLYVLLASFGDLINLLPVIKDRVGNGPPARVLVCKPYASLFEGVSYCEPVIWDGTIFTSKAAVKYANKLASGDVIDCVVFNGGDYRYRQYSQDFCREAWRKAGIRKPWGSLPLVFDRRDPAREARMIESLGLDGRKLVVLNFAGVAAPFTPSPELKPALVKAFPEVQFLDISKFRAERFYDLLGLFEKASALITVDSGPLHLARAVPTLPVLAYTYHVLPGKPDRTLWAAAPWWPQQVYRCGYHRAPQSVSGIVEALRSVLGGEKGPVIHHVYSIPNSLEGSLGRRMTTAKTTWEAEYRLGQCWRPAGIRDSELDRSSAVLGDPRPVPFIRDLVAAGLEKCKENDILFLTNSDVCFVPGVTGRILDAVREYGSAFTYRWDFKAPLPSVCEEPDVESGTWYLGCDAFAFSVKWWKQHGALFPDMLLGRPSWDTVMRALMKLTRGVDIPRSIYHEEHASFWYADGRVSTLPGNKYNVPLAYQFFKDFNCGGNDWRTAEDRPVGYRLAEPEIKLDEQRQVVRRATQAGLSGIARLRGLRFERHLSKFKAAHQEISWEGFKV
jgi:hypothetical protein